MTEETKKEEQMQEKPVEEKPEETVGQTETKEEQASVETQKEEAPAEEAKEETTKDSFGREMHKAKCADCGKECEVPFKPSGDRPVYCRDCYRKHAPKRRY